MPGKVKVKILAGRNLPVMDRSSDTTDAYVEIKLGNTTHKTDVCRKSLNPQWNSEWYRFEMDDAELQDEPLQIRLMDYDMYSANDAIGKVYVDLNPLLLPNYHNTQSILPTVDLTTTFSNSGGTVHNQTCLGPGSVFSGWIPVYDTMHGIRGEVNVTVKVELFNDFNKFRQSSCGVQFFYTSCIPYGYHVRVVHGFVEELIVNDDPEYHWIDKIRTPRASNEARQTLFFKLSGEIQRKIGLKAIEIGANSVIGYQQSFDLEGDSGIVARGIGTAVTLVRVQDKMEGDSSSNKIDKSSLDEPGYHYEQDHSGHCRTESVGSKVSKINATLSSIHRRSSDSDLSITQKGNSLSSTERPVVSGTVTGISSINRPPVPLKQTNWEILEFPFITMFNFPVEFIRHIGGTVSARSVKLLERVSNIEEPETRDAWWTELRMEIRSHMRALACNVVLGYTERTSICDDVCVLSASGTAAVINIKNLKTQDQGDLPVFLPRQNTSLYEALEKLQIKTTEFTGKSSSQQDPVSQSVASEHQEFVIGQMAQDSSTTNTKCTICHVPYSESSVPYPIVLRKCGVCKHARVPDVLLTTIDLPEGSVTVGRGCLIQSHICRPKRDLRTESNAKEISDSLPFLEYDLHRLLINKLKVKGMNAIFGMRIQIAIGEKVLVGIATGTAVYLLPLPVPTLPKLVSSITTVSENDELLQTQKSLVETVKKNREYYQVNVVDDQTNANLVGNEEETHTELPALDLTTGNKDSCVLEIDDAEDADIITMLMAESPPPTGFHVVNIENFPGLDEFELGTEIQMFNHISRVKLPTHQYSLRFGTLFKRLLQCIYFKLRRSSPCVISQLRFHVDLSELDEVQLTTSGTVVGIVGKVNRQNKEKRKANYSTSKDLKKGGVFEYEGIFTLEEDEEPNASESPMLTNKLKTGAIPKPIDGQLFQRGIDITSLSYISGGHIVQYLGNINFFFIRESTSIREGSGLSGFVHSFVTEVLAIVRAHIGALGGNAMVAYFMNECVLFKNPHKNQGQCIIHVGGDVVFVSYHTDTCSKVGL